MSALRRSSLAALLLAGTTAIALACGSSFSEEAPSPSADGGTDTSSDATPAPPCDVTKLDVDGLHCGRCDHSCLGGTCAAGVCQPVLIGSSTGELVSGIAVNATRVFWVTNNAPLSGFGHVWSCPKDGCPGTGPSELGKAQVGSLASDGTTAFVSFVYGTRRLNQIGPDGTLNKVAVGDHSVAESLCVRDGTLFFHSRYEGNGNDAGVLMGTAFRWDGTIEKALGGYSGENMNAFVASPTGDAVFFGRYGRISRCVAGMCVPFRDGGVNLNGRLTADEVDIYWTTDAGELLRCPLAGPCSMPKTVVSPSMINGNALAVAHDEGRLYIATSAGDIIGCDRANCPGTAKPIAHEARLFVGNEYIYDPVVVADKAAIYWAAVDGVGPAKADGGGEDTSGLAHHIMKLAK